MAAFTGVLAVAAGVAGYIWFSQNILDGLPNDLTAYRDWHPLTNVMVLDHDGEQVDRFAMERREWVDLDTLPDHVWQSFVAAEDRRFFEHPGVDAFGIARALFNNAFTGERMSGASTLTQQLVKNLLIGKEKSYIRKMKEAVLAYRLERDIGKERILELYVNYVALGSGNYGVEAAAEDYFGIHAAEMDVAQSALLAGLVPAPSRYSPRRAKTVSMERRGLVLQRMVRAGYLSPDEAEGFSEAPIVLHRRVEPVSEINAAYLTEVRREVRRLFDAQAPYQSGLTVHTHLRQDIQLATVTAVERATELHRDRQGALGVREVVAGLPPASTDPCFLATVGMEGRKLMARTEGGAWAIGKPDVLVTTATGPRPLRSTLKKNARIRICPSGEGTAELDPTPWSQAAAVVIEHKTGELVAIAGGRDVLLEGFNRASQAKRQPGSSFKPYIYGAALEGGATQLSVMVDGPISFGGWSPKNYGGGYRGSTTLRAALAASLNTVAVRLTLKEGTERVVQVARDLGVRTPLRTDPTVALGSSEVTPLDQAVGYAAIVRGGVPIAPVWMRRIETLNGPAANAGEVLELVHGKVQLPGAPGKRVLRPDTAYQVVDMLREVVRNGTARRAWNPKLDRGGKTGTTNDFVDAWFVGFTVNHVIAVWVGTDGVGTLGDKETGGRAALPAWMAIAEALAEPEGARIEAPPEIGLIQKDGQVIALPWGAHAAARQAITSGAVSAP